jgi:hypothetical protein
MASRDLVNKIAEVQLLAPADKVHTNWKSSILDTAGFEAAALVLHIGALTGADGSNLCTLSMQESNDTVDGNFTAVAKTANPINGVASSTADFGDQNLPFAGDITSVLPAPAAMPALYAGFPVINNTNQANQDIIVGYIGSKRYIRLSAVYTGTGISAGVMGVSGILGHAQYEPVSAPAAIVAS